MAGIDLGSILERVGLPTSDLSAVENPKGRVDFLASKLIEVGVRQFAPGLTGLHQSVRPIIDGQLEKHLRGVKLPFVKQAPQRRTRKARVKK
jgi:hypothetical protein